MMKLAKKVEQQKKFPNEQQGPQALAFPVLLQLYGAYCTHQHAAAFHIAKQIEREQKSRRKAARGQISSSGHFLIVISIKSPQKRVTVLKPNGVTEIYGLSESQTNPASLSSTSCISLLLLKSHTALSGAALPKRMFLGVKEWVFLFCCGLCPSLSSLCQLVGS